MAKHLSRLNEPHMSLQQKWEQCVEMAKLDYECMKGDPGITLEVEIARVAYLRGMQEVLASTRNRNRKPKRGKVVVIDPRDNWVGKKPR